MLAHLAGRPASRQCSWFMSRKHAQLEDHWFYKREFEFPLPLPSLESNSLTSQRTSHCCAVPIVLFSTHQFTDRLVQHRRRRSARPSELCEKSPTAQPQHLQNQKASTEHSRIMSVESTLIKLLPEWRCRDVFAIARARTRAR